MCNLTPDTSTIMTTVNQTFSAPRFGRFLKKYIGENYRQLLLFSALILGLMLFMAIFTTLTSFKDARTILETNQQMFAALNEDSWISFLDKYPFVMYPYKTYHNTIDTWLIIIPMFMMAIAASFAFSRCGNKEGRLREFMIPASQLEKFLASFSIYILGAWVVVMVSWLIARYGVPFAMDIFTPYGAFYRPWSLTENLSKSGTANNFYTACVELALFIQSLFLLGSVLWPKISYIKTFGAGFLVTAAIGLTVIATSSVLGNSDLGFGRPAPWIIDPSFYLMLGVILSIVNYVIAYFRYRELDLTNRW